MLPPLSEKVIGPSACWMTFFLTYVAIRFPAKVSTSADVANTGLGSNHPWLHVIAVVQVPAFVRFSGCLFCMSVAIVRFQVLISRFRIDLVSLYFPTGVEV